MTRLLVSSGQGPAECRIAVRHVLRRMAAEHPDLDVSERGDKHGPASAIVTLHGGNAAAVAARWLGTIQWTCKSPVRPKHKRQNWFVGVFALPDLPKAGTLDPADLRIETFRAGGPGGQHQNTTDSAVRVTHLPSGASSIARDGRSQHRNKQLALDRLNGLLMAQAELEAAAMNRDANLAHHQLERGNPVRRFKGERFVEVR